MPGRRERKKQQTRAQIAEAARILFSERGFEAVTVVEIAEAADVSEQTVYNHFPTKEDLVYWRAAEFEAELLGAVQDRSPGESVLDALGRFLREPRGLLATNDPAIRDQLTSLIRVMVESPALRAREQSVIAGYTESLARLIARETSAGDDDVEPKIAAGALLSVHAMLIDAARTQILAGVQPKTVARQHRARADRALALLGRGLHAYALKDVTDPVDRSTPLRSLGELVRLHWSVSSAGVSMARAEWGR